MIRRAKAFLYAWISRRYMHDCTSYNTLAVRKSCRSKAQAREVFARHGVPHARGAVFFWPWTAAKFARAHGFPLVVKPNVSGYSRGSYFPVNTHAELMRAVALAKIWWPLTVVEQYLLGANYRVLCTGEKIISVIRRYPPFVTGTGKDSISALIDAENRVRKEMKLHPVIYPIAKSAQVAAHLKKSGRNFESVPQAGEHVELFHRVALAPGGVVEVIGQKTLAEDNAALCMRVVKMFNANILGIDVIFEKGIETSYQKQKCIFIEVNSRPYAQMHHHPRYGRAEDLSAHYAELDRLDIADTDIF